jgi:hypothetical protein
MVVLFGDFFVVLLLSNLSTLASLNDAFSATYRRPIHNFIMTLTLYVIVRFEGRLLHFTTLFNVRFGGRLLRHVGRLYTFTSHNKFNLEARGPILDRDV